VQDAVKADQATEDSYKASWNRASGTLTDAFAAVDGSPDEEVLRLHGQFIADMIAAALLLKDSDWTMELGCGVGRIGRELAPRCGRWIGADISENMIAIARERTGHLSNVEYRVLTRTALDPFPDNSLDKIYSHAVFIHLDKADLFLYLQEIARVLKPGGLVYFDTWNLADEVGWKRWLLEVNRPPDPGQPWRRHPLGNQFSVSEEIAIYLQRVGLSDNLLASESFWIQTVTTKADGLSPRTVERLREQVSANRERIVPTPIFKELFAAQVEFLAGRLSPAEAYWSLVQMPDSREVTLYRTWLEHLWRRNQAQYGPYPPQ
jgi:SAM-dependent methyltransferase